MAIHNTAPNRRLDIWTSNSENDDLPTYRSLSPYATKLSCCSATPPHACHSGLADPKAELGSLTSEEGIALCKWANEIMFGVTASAGCAIDYTPLDCSVPGSFLQKMTLVGCHWTVAGLEKCMSLTQGNICAAVTVGFPECSNDLCNYSPEGTPCTDAAECTSNRCCADNASADKHCGGVCDVASTGDACTTDDYCAPGKCVDHKCLVSPLRAGSACESDAWCDSGTCQHGICKGTATQGDFCTEDYHCEAGRDCCGTRCGKVNVGCIDGNGDACGYCASEDAYCIDDAFCSVPTCTEDTDCGFNPWGFANHCARNLAGKNLCFSGCSTICEDTIGPGFYCTDLPIIEKGATFGKVCSGGSSLSDEVIVDPKPAP